MSDRRTIIRNATVLTMDPASRIPRVADVVITGTTIDRVIDSVKAVDGQALEGRSDDVVIDGSGCILIPGFVDTHRHMWEAVLRGSQPQLTLTEYLREFSIDIGGSITARDVYVGTTLSAHAAQLSGVTTVQDIANIQDTPAHTDASLAALAESGSRAVFAYGNSTARIADCGVAISDDVHRTHREVEHSGNSLLAMALVCEWGSDEEERANAALAADLGMRVARHLSAKFPIARLRQLGVLTEGTTVIHGNGYGSDDLAMIADAGATLSVSPAIEQIMGHGVPLLGTGPNSLTVSFSSDVEITCSGDMFTQMRAAYLASRRAQLSVGEARGVTVGDVLDMATRQGAAALGLADQIGTISPGKQADLVLLRADRADVAPVIDPYSTVVLHMDRSHIDTVVIGGRIVVKQGVPVLTINDVIGEATAAAARLIASGEQRSRR